MDEFRKRFWDTFEQMQEDFDRFFDHYARAKRPALVGYRTRWSPPCNVYETEREMCILVEIAGMNREALDVCVEENYLKLHGLRAEPCVDVHGAYHQMEIAFGEFELEVPLPSPVDAEQARARYANGFLQVTLPKAAQPISRTITLTVPDQE